MSEQSPYNCVILLAGGSGSRMQGSVDDKILHSLAGKPVWRHSFDAFQNSNRINTMVIVHRDEEQKHAIESDLPRTENIIFTPGGSERQDSVWAGLQAAPVCSKIILIHDCARPLISPETIGEAIEAAQKTGAACVARKTTDTIKRCTPNSGGDYTLHTVDRTSLWSMETPQVFGYSLIKDAYQSIIENNLPITDDLSAVESSNQPVTFVENPIPNIKITTPQDLALAEYLLSS